MINETFIDNIYIVHGIAGYHARQEILEDVLRKKYRLDFEFVTESFNEKENDNWIKQYFASDIKQKLTKGAMLCTMVHILIYEKIVKNNDRYAIIFENDVCLIGEKFIENIKVISKEANSLPEGFIISLENTSLQFPPLRQIKKNKHLYLALWGRCAGAYIIDQKAAQLMINDLKNEKCKEVIDWWHNDMIKRNVIKMYWAHPPLTEQGSFNGKLVSSISSRSNGYIRRVKWLLQKFYKMYLLRLFR